MKTPITYYGGKQMLCHHILPLIPPHVLYCEPFAGGLAVFFSKEPSEIEVVNDINGELVNFYHVLKNRFDELQQLVHASPYSRKEHLDASVIYNYPHLFGELQRAWAVWMLTQQGFGGKLNDVWGYEKTHPNAVKKFGNKKEAFTPVLAERLEKAHLESADALYVIKSRDTERSFFYLDPPYTGSSLGPYNNYYEKDFMALLELLCEIKGKFLLSSYPSALLGKYAAQQGWQQQEITRRIALIAKSGNTHKKEMLTANYAI